MRSILIEIVLEIVAAADPLAVDEHLRRGRDGVLLLECVNLVARPEDAVVDVKVRLLQQLFGADPEWTDVIRQYHAIERRCSVLRHNASPRT